MAQPPSAAELGQGPWLVAKECVASTVVVRTHSARLSGPAEEHVVLVKENAIEVLIRTRSGLDTVCEQSSLGTILSSAVLPWRPSLVQHGDAGVSGMAADSILVTTDTGLLLSLALCIHTKRLLVRSRVRVSVGGVTSVAVGHYIAVDPESQVVALGAYDDLIALFRLPLPTVVSGDATSVESAMNGTQELQGNAFSSFGLPVVSTRELISSSPMAVDVPDTELQGTIWGLELVRASGRTENATVSPVTSSDGLGKLRLVVTKSYGKNLPELFIFDVDVATRTTSFLGRVQNLPDVWRVRLSIDISPCVTHVIAIPNVRGFAVVVCPGQVAVLHLTDRCAREIGVQRLPRPESASEPVVVSAWSWEQTSPRCPRLLLALNEGNLHALSIEFSDVGGNSTPTLSLGPISYSFESDVSALVSLEDRHLLAFLHLGDGHLLKPEDGSWRQVDEIPNLAPFHDFQCADLLDEGQDQIFACSGNQKTGSVKVIRAGYQADHIVSSSQDYPGMTEAWTLRLSRRHRHDSYLVMSFVAETRLLSLGAALSDLTDSSGFIARQRTLACGRVGEFQLVQVCPTEVRLCQYTDRPRTARAECLQVDIGHWTPPAGYGQVQVGAIGNQRVLVSFTQPENSLLLLGVQSLSTACRDALIVLRSLVLQHELSCIAFPVMADTASGVPLRQSGAADDKADKRDIQHRESENTDDACPVPFCVVGTYAPSMEILWIEERNFQRLAMTSLLDDHMKASTAPQYPSGYISGRGDTSARREDDRSEEAHSVRGDPYLGRGTPESVQMLVLGRLARVLVGMRDGALLCFAWPSSSLLWDAKLPNAGSPWQLPPSVQNCEDNLKLVFGIQCGSSPVRVVPVETGVFAGSFLAQSDVSWILRGRSSSYCFDCRTISLPRRSLSQSLAVPFSTTQPSIEHGLIVVADASLHLYSMSLKMNNVKEISTRNLSPRRILCEMSSKTLLVAGYQCSASGIASSTVHCMHPESGVVHCTVKLRDGDTVNAMCLWRPKLGLTQETFLVLSTQTSPDIGAAHGVHSAGPLVRGRVSLVQVVVNEGTRTGYTSSGLGGSGEEGQTSEPPPELRLVGEWGLGSPPGFCVQPYQADCLLVSTGPHLTVFRISSSSGQVPGTGLDELDDRDEDRRPRNEFSLRKVGQSLSLRSTIVSLSVHGSRIAIGCQKDSVLYCTFDLNQREFHHLWMDPTARVVSDIAWSDELEECWCLDRRGSFLCLAPSRHVKDACALAGEDKLPEHNLECQASYSLGGSVALRLRPGRFRSDAAGNDMRLSQWAVDQRMTSDRESPLFSRDAVIGTMLGSVVVVSKIARLDFELLRVVEDEMLRSTSSCQGQPLCHGTSGATSSCLGQGMAAARTVASRRCLRGYILKEFCFLREPQQLQVTQNVRHRIIEKSNVPPERVESHDGGYLCDSMTGKPAGQLGHLGCLLSEMSLGQTRAMILKALSHCDIV
mmetsp:Transcript_5209/g.19094  ORF Transcript_5209/g.19094 Transcript_5209/m.19094 type:complete len:1463 (+) Transcript_5209:152-4540(+)